MIRVDSNDPKALLADIRDALREGEDADGKSIETWEVDSDGNLRHTGENGQWEKRGYMLPVVKKRSLEFLFKSGTERNVGAYGVLNGRLLTLLVNHFSAAAQRIEFLDKREPS